MRLIKFRLRIGSKIVGYESFIKIEGEAFGAWKYNKANGDIWTNDYIPHSEKDLFTGLKDNKRTKECPEGQEIYEGDIVKGLGEHHSISEVIWDKSGARFNLKFPDRKYLWALQECWCDTFEVIGNIRENPELLKEAK